jgi:hypothetical protein
MIFSILFVTLINFSSSALANEIPPNAKTVLKLHCAVILDGPYATVQKIIIRDVLYKKPPGLWDNNNSALEVIFPDGSVQAGEMNESNGNDPQDYRDSDPSEYSGTGGLGIYSLNTVTKPIVFMTHSQKNQRNLPKRSYGLTIGEYESTTGQLTPISQGSLSCEVIL